MDLQKLLRPRSMVILGASEKYGLGSDTCRNAQAFCRDLSRVYYVHPKYDTVFGRKCYPDIASVPDSIDLLVICTNQRTVIPAMEQAASKGAGGGGIRQRLLGDAYAGRAPAGGELAQAAQRLDMAVHGSQLRGIREPNRRDLQFCLCRADGRKGRRDRLFLPEPGSSASICSTARNYVFPWRYREATAGLCSRRTIWNTWWRTETLG